MSWEHDTHEKQRDNQYDHIRTEEYQHANVPDSADNVPETLTETAESLAGKLSVSTKTIKRDLKRMKELGIIK